MASGVEWLANNNNTAVPGVANWVSWYADARFTTPEDIGIVIMQTINVNTKTAYNWGVRHPDEATAALATILGNYKTVLFCGAKDTGGGAGTRCQVETYRNGAASQYINRVIGGIKRDSCQWDNTPASFTTASGNSAWQEMNIYGAGPPPNARFAILEVRAGSLEFGVRHPDDVSSQYRETVEVLGHFLAPIRMDSATEYYVEVWHGLSAVTYYVRGWIKPTNPGIFACNPVQAIPIGTVSTNRSIDQSRYAVTGGFFVAYNTFATPYWCKVGDPDWTMPDQYDVIGLIGQAAGVNTNEQIVDQSEVAYGLGMLAFSGTKKWTHNIGGVPSANIGGIGGVDIDDIGGVGGTD